MGKLLPSEVQRLSLLEIFKDSLAKHLLGILE